eukprot:Amastigsp_a678637_19.p5 type:complete len:105 gc:universal Amastigsp_a678637_19:1104-790(-)
MVVTSSRSAETTAMNVHRMSMRRHTEPLESLYARTAAHSKNPVPAKMPTMSIIPKSSASVSYSIQETMVSSVGRSSIVANAASVTNEPSIAVTVRSMTSKTMSV